jgi:peptide/nickel transport system substrate-binding protein
VNSSTRKQLAAVVAAAVASIGFVSATPASEDASPRGGTYRVGWEQRSFFWTRSFDPTGEYQLGAFGIYSNLLVRTLVGYNHVAGAAGRTLVPDLAVSVPAPTNGGRTYSFRLKRGIRFAPPAAREITSYDIRYAIERLARPQNGGEYPLYYEVIQGFGAYRARKANSISGIATPSAKRITFTLTRPAGDFLHRLALPAAGPIPPEVARCFEGKPGRYGGNLVSSGPYMLEGSAAVRISSCSAIRPVPGLSDTQLSLVRNPRYDARTDTKAARENNPDRFVFIVLGKTPGIVSKLTSGELEDAFFKTGASSMKLLERYAANARKRGALRLNPAGWPHYITLNLTQPPFDDLHVRRALSLIIDKAALRATFGGPLAGPIGHHIVPDELLGNRLRGFAPFRTSGDHGNLARARAEMAKSKYATKGGVCIAKACKGVFLAPLYEDVNFNAGEIMAPIVKANAKLIGIGFRQSARDYIRILTPSYNLAASPSTHWPADYPDPGNLVERFFAGSAIRPKINLNTSLVGITPAQASRLGVTGKVKGVPSVDGDIARCSRLAGDTRLDCYAQLDRKLSAQVVPWIPFLWRNRINILGPQVAKWGFDQAAGTTAYAHVAVKR